MLCVSCKDSHYTQALSPEEAMDRMILREGFEIELMASEPHVKDPVEMVIDEQGTIYVVEMPDYPFKPEKGKQKGRIKILEDQDGDGKIDHHVIFADKLMEATSILPWDGGLIVTAAPDILYLKDTTGDQRADIKQVLFTGFFENNSEAQITNLRFNIDNWIYASNFGQAGKITSPLAPNRDTLIVNGGDFRFRLDTLMYEVAAGPTQFGQGIDDWGNRFVTQNSLHIRQILIPWRYLYRHDHLPSKEAVVQVSDHDPMMYQLTTPPYWREERTRRRQATYHERGLDRIEYAANNFTGATGTTVYMGDAFPEDFYGSVFIGDVAGNLVHRDVITYPSNKIHVMAQRDRRERTREFLVSADPWFRPVNFYVGHDGHLYVLDMYRQHIETPLAIPEDLKEEMDFYNGMDKGRIYKIIPDSIAERSIDFDPQFNKLTIQQLSQLLTHENGWCRFTAHRVLVQRNNKGSISFLEALLAHPKPQTRLHALYCMDAISGLSTPQLLQALSDTHPAIRAHALMLSESRYELIDQIIEMVSDTSRHVRFQLALSLGAFHGTEVIEAMKELLEQEHENPWFRKAILSSEAGTSIEMITRLAQSGFFDDEQRGKMSFLQDFVYVASFSEEKLNGMSSMIFNTSSLQNENYQIAIAQGVRKSILSQDTPNISPSFEDLYHHWANYPSDTIQGIAQQIEKWLSPQNVSVRP